jgi:hypothetical protein
VAGAQVSHVQVSPSDAVFVVGTDRPRRSARFGQIRLATTREAAFADCLAPYRPCHGVDARIDAWLQSPHEDPDVVPSGTLCGRFFDDRVLFELRSVRTAVFEPAIRQHRFVRITHSRVAHRALVGARALGVLSADPPIGHELRLLDWSYLVVWNHRTAVAMLEVHDRSSIHVTDWDLRMAADRLGITLT